ncbi:MAG: TetR/AcrR family transcriptional regulator, partial [Thermodesulfobacteriota bacterium]
EQNIQKRRRKILETARLIVEEQGPEAVKMRDLAERAGFSVTTLYNLFDNKDDLLVALLEDALVSVTPLLEAQKQSDPFAAIQEIMAGPVQYLVDHSRILRPILAVLYYKAERRAAPYAIEIFTGIIAALARMVEAAQKEGFLLPTPPPRLLAAEIFYSYRMALEDWGCREIDDGQLASRVQTGVLLLLLSVATDKSRAHLQGRLESVQARALDYLVRRFPGLELLP